VRPSTRECTASAGAAFQDRISTALVACIPKMIEEKIGIPESRKDDFRREVMNYIGV
jgi:predicted Ser/Thr protein kinase